MPIDPPRKYGTAIARKAINWYQREYKLEKYLLQYITRNKFDILLMNNTIYESKNFVNVGYRSYKRKNWN